MLTPLELKTLVTENLLDIRLYSIQDILTKLIVRPDYLASGLPQYRMVNTVTNTDITTLDMFIASISELYITTSIYTLNQYDYSIIRPFIISLNNIKLSMNIRAKSDSDLATVCHPNADRIMLLVNYLNDSDALTIPLKITDVLFANSSAL